jgi:hypothetical protein
MVQVWVERERQLVAEENEVSPLLTFFFSTVLVSLIC